MTGSAHFAAQQKTSLKKRNEDEQESSYFLPDANKHGAKNNSSES